MQIQKRAVERLREAPRAATAGDGPASRSALRDASREVGGLIEAAPWLPASVREASPHDGGGARGAGDVGTGGLLGRRGPRRPRPRRLLAARGRRRGLVLQGSFARSKPGPRPRSPPTAATPPPWDRRRWRCPPPPGPTGATAIRFEPVRGQLTEETFGGGPSKWHLVESGGNGVALLDYDGDGLLDIYVVSALRARREERPRPASRTATPSTATWAG